MQTQKRLNESINWFMGEMQAEIVARSGRPGDRFHLGKMVLHGLRKYPDIVLQLYYSVMAARELARRKPRESGGITRVTDISDPPRRRRRLFSSESDLKREYKRIFIEIVDNVKNQIQTRNSSLSNLSFLDLLMTALGVAGLIRCQKHMAGRSLVDRNRDSNTNSRNPLPTDSQIDGGTGAAETNRSVLERTIQCATAMRGYGLQVGDVITLMAPSHLDLCVPFYAALYLGVIVAAVDRYLGTGELTETFSIGRPKLIFCQSEKAPDVQRALNDIDLDTQILTFDKGDYLCSFNEFLQRHGKVTPIDQFEAADFDAEDAIALLISTSGTTGLPKAAAITHKNLAISTPNLWHVAFSRCFSL
ncbi:Luciferin 4-monooxygenase [Eumeta japonica]|uniref:Luciferin 4-monooxygenase n=1 Tax=Eumeta variegata TaxID=151549 RepID=A0A4C1V9V9_EUMVA|nr:Luciferin 4-monooxygenase [Eumeta japonica]